MKRCSFKVAKVVKEAGYPQRITPTVYVLQEYKIGNHLIPQGHEKPSWGEDDYHLHPDGDFADIPTYLEVWLWLWKEKAIAVLAEDKYCSVWDSFQECLYTKSYPNSVKDPEEAIIAAIKCLLNENLLK